MIAAVVECQLAKQKAVVKKKKWGRHLFKSDL